MAPLNGTTLWRHKIAPFLSNKFIAPKFMAP